MCSTDMSVIGCNTQHVKNTHKPSRSARCLHRTQIHTGAFESMMFMKCLIVTHFNKVLKIIRRYPIFKKLCSVKASHCCKYNLSNGRTCHPMLKWKAAQVSVGMWWAAHLLLAALWALNSLCFVPSPESAEASLSAIVLVYSCTRRCLLRDERHCLWVARTHKLQLHTKHSRRDASWGRWGQWGHSALLN